MLTLGTFKKQLIEHKSRLAFIFDFFEIQWIHICTWHLLVQNEQGKKIVSAIDALQKSRLRRKIDPFRRLFFSYYTEVYFLLILHQKAPLAHVCPLDFEKVRNAGHPPIYGPLNGGTFDLKFRFAVRASYFSAHNAKFRIISLKIKQ